MSHPLLEGLNSLVVCVSLLLAHGPGIHCQSVQGVYKFNWTNFQEISRRLQEGFQEKSRTCLHCFGLLCNVICFPCRCSLPKYRTKTWYAFYTTLGCSKDKIGRPVSTQISDLVPSFMTGNQCGRSPYTKISRRSNKFQEISRISRRVFKFQDISRSCRHPAVFVTQHCISTCSGISWRQFCEIFMRCTQSIRDPLRMCYINWHFTMAAYRPVNSQSWYR